MPTEILSSSADALLSARGLRKAYVSGGTRQLVLDDLDLDLARGEIVAVIGASGSGKTSLLNLLCGIDSPDAGDVVIDGIDVHARREPDKTLFRRRHVGFVFQFFNLIPTLTVRENLALPLELLGRPQAEIAMRVSGLLDGIALAHIAERFPDTLSGGEQQRVAVARALAHTPSLLLADEPTGNLDTHTAGNVTALLIDMTRAHRAAMVIVTHSPAVAACADRQLRLADGRLVGV